MTDIKTVDMTARLLELREIATMSDEHIFDEYCQSVVDGIHAAYRDPTPVQVSSDRQLRSYYLEFDPPPGTDLTRGHKGRRESP